MQRFETPQPNPPHDTPRTLADLGRAVLERVAAREAEAETANEAVTFAYEFEVTAPESDA